MTRHIKSTFYADHKLKDYLYQKSVYKKNDMRDFRRICRMVNYLLSVKKSYPDHSDYRGLRASSAQQFCTVKMRYGLEVSRHIRFLRMYMPQKNKKEITEKPELFSSVPVDKDFLSSYQRTMVGKHYKFIISPGSQNVDIQALVKTLIPRMEAATGFKFDWIAAVHTNTEHNHAHLLINGIDKNGHKIDCFKNTFLKETIREMSRQICTEMIGQRTAEEIRNSLLQLPSCFRYCQLDKLIEMYEQPCKDEDMTEVFPRNTVMQERLSHLLKLGLAQKKENTEKIYLLEKDWAKKLKAVGKYNSFLSSRRELMMVLPSELELYTKKSGEVTGIVTRLYRMNDEDSWTNAVVVENSEKAKAWYIPLFFEPEEMLQNATIQCKLEANQKGVLTPKIKVLHWGIQQYI